CGSPGCLMQKFPTVKFHGIAPWKYGQRGDSFRLDVRGLETRPPFLDLGLLLGGERFRRLLLARWNVLTLIGKTLPHGCIGQRSLHRRIEPRDGLPGRSFRDPESVPKRGVKPGDP